MSKLAPRPTAQREDLEAALPPPRPCRDPITDLPILILFPHSRCNCRCVMCDIWRVTAKEEISPEEIDRWLPELRELGVTRVVLSGGEPLMHSDLWTLCESLHSAGIGITLLSTGILLARNAARVVEYCDDVVVSLDGPREIHDRVRRIPRAFEKLKNGVAAVKALDGSVRVTGRCTVQRENLHSLRATVEAAHELALDRISFLAADVSTEAFNRPGGWEPDRAAAVAPDENALAVLETELDALERYHSNDFDSGYIAESPAKLRTRLYQYFAALLDRDDFPAIECNAPWVSTVIETDGTVRPCFFQPPLGNLRQSGSLAAILNSAEAIAWRRGLDTHRDSICRKCVCSLTLREGAVRAAAAGQ